MQHRDIGMLHFPDGREFGQVHYVIDERPPMPTALGRITGKLRPVEPATHFPFWDFTNPEPVYGALRLADGRWWLCNIQADGEATNRSGSGGLLPPGPQPKPE